MGNEKSQKLTCLLTETTTFRYNGTNRLVAERNPAYLEVSYHYSPAGQLLSRILSNGARTDYTYDLNHWMSSQRNKSANGADVNWVSYVRDATGQITAEWPAGLFIPEHTDYRYDPLYRVTQADYRHSALTPSTPNDESFTYDKTGNRMTRSLTQSAVTNYYVHDLDNHLLELRSGSASGPLVTAFVYDADGNLITKCEGGTVTRTGTTCTGSTVTTLAYDAKNRVGSIAKTGQSTLTMKYDPLDYRIEKNSERYLLEGEHLEAIYTTSNQLRAKYLRGSVIDEIVNGYQSPTPPGLLTRIPLRHNTARWIIMKICACHVPATFHPNNDDRLPIAMNNYWCLEGEETWFDVG